jgi:hypothetical protein
VGGPARSLLQIIADLLPNIAEQQSMQSSNTVLAFPDASRPMY